MPAASKPVTWTPGTHSPQSTGLPCLCPTQKTLHRLAETFHRTICQGLRFSDRTDEFTFRWHLMHMKCSTFQLFFDLVQIKAADFHPLTSSILTGNTRFVTMVLFFNGDLVIRVLCFFNPGVHTTPEQFENSVFTLETHQMFSVHTTLENEAKTQQGQRSHVIIVKSSFSKYSVFN